MADSSASVSPNPIISLTKRVANAAASQQRWHTAYLWLVAIAAAAAVFGFIAQWIESDRATQLSDATDALMKEKDRQSAIEIAAVSAQGNEAKKEAGLANERAAKLENEAAQARLETERIKKFVAWREITPEASEQFKQFVALLPRGRIQVQSLAQNLEAESFGRRISAMLTHAGYAVEENPGSLERFGPIPVGVILRYNVPFTPTHAKPLESALESIGIHPVFEQADVNLGDLVLLLVGNKP